MRRLPWVCLSAPSLAGKSGFYRFGLVGTRPAHVLEPTRPFPASDQAVHVQTGCAEEIA
jgi:hypothetical protein